MTRLQFLVEGSTELRFIKSVLAPHLGAIGIMAYPIAVLTSKDRRLSREYRGGINSYQQVKADLLRLIKRYGTKHNTWFTTMIDLYRLPSDFPGYLPAGRNQHYRQRVEYLERELGADVNHARFIPYIQLHEYEALLLSAPDRFRSFYEEQEHEAGIQRLQALASRYSSPEEIDDGSLTAPSKRIIAEIPQYEDDKASAGPQIVGQIGLALIRQKCPHFNDWITRIENLSSSGNPA